MDRRHFLLAASAASTAMASAAPGKPQLWPCINQQTTLDAPFDAECAAYASAGFRHVELWFPKLKALGLPASLVRLRLRLAGLTPICACSTNGKLTFPLEEFKRNLDELKDNLELAQSLGVRCYVMTSSPPSSELCPDEYEMAAERLATVAEMAASYRVRIALEFTARSRLCACLQTALSVVRTAAHPNAGICLDTFHFFVGPSKTEDLADVKPGEIAHVHFHDVPRAVPRERLSDADRLPPGEGCLPLDRFTAALRKTGYHGALSVELFGTAFHAGDPKTVAERCYRAVRKYSS